MKEEKRERERESLVVSVDGGKGERDVEKKYKMRAKMRAGKMEKRKYEETGAMI